MLVEARRRWRVIAVESASTPAPMMTIVEEGITFWSRLSWLAGWLVKVEHFYVPMRTLCQHNAK